MLRKRFFRIGFRKRTPSPCFPVILAQRRINHTLELLGSSLGPSCINFPDREHPLRGIQFKGMRSFSRLFPVPFRASYIANWSVTRSSNRTNGLVSPATGSHQGATNFSVNTCKGKGSSRLETLVSLG